MKITHPSGQPYDLDIDTKLEMTRYNPFFNEKGEQSIPISLPASDHNLALLKHPEITAGRSKIARRLDAQIQSGIFSVNARQAILSARKNESIETSFYLREGAFYEKTKDISLQEIFEEKSIEFDNIDAAIAFMRSLLPNTDKRFTCFQVLTESYVLNKRSNATHSDGYSKFVKEDETTETIDEKTITVPKGFYLTPFIKVKHLLEEVLSYIGYTLGPSFLDNPPFSDMCFLNNNIDSIVSNRIDYAVIVPNITVAVFFDILRKFNLELIPDEQKKVVHLTFFDDIVNSPISENLSANVAGELHVHYHHDYKQLKLTSDRLPIPAELNIINAGRMRDARIRTSEPKDRNVSLLSIVTQYPTAYIRKLDGAIVRDGFKGDSSFVEKVGSLSFDYFAGGILEVEEKSFPDVIPDVYYGMIDSGISNGSYPFVGDGRALYSSMLLSNESEENITEGEKNDNTELDPMLCFSHVSNAGEFRMGTINNYSIYGDRLWDYSLMFNGVDGIFERFWRKRDDLLRNALLEVEADLLLSEHQKFTLSTMNRVTIDGQHMFISELSYTPESNSVEPCKLLTTKLQEPISIAKTETEYFTPQQYKWKIARAEKSWEWPSGRPSSGYAYRYLTEPVTFYPPFPTEAQYNAGGKYYERVYEVEYGQYDPRSGAFNILGTGTVSVWLEAIKA